VRLCPAWGQTTEPLPSSISLSDIFLRPQTRHHVHSGCVHLCDTFSLILTYHCPSHPVSISTSFANTPPLLALLDPPSFHVILSCGTLRLILLLALKFPGPTLFDHAQSQLAALLLSTSQHQSAFPAACSPPELVKADVLVLSDPSHAIPCHLPPTHNGRAQG